MLRNKEILVFALVTVFAWAFYFHRQANNTSRVVSSEKLSSTNVDRSNVISPTKGSSLMTARSTGLQKISNSTYVERLARVREECLRIQGHYNEGRISLKKWIDNPIKHGPHIYVSDKYKIAVCNVPKCGSTQWRNLIATLESNYKELTKSESDLVWRERLIWRLHDISTPRGYEAAEKKLNEYYRIMTVREPLERLVSAYKDRLEEQTGSLFGPISREIHSKYGNGSAGTATFSEFVTSILDESSPENLNQHWKPFTYNCDPCLFNFDIIAKLETINQDFPYIAKKLHIRRNSTFSDKSDTLNRKWRTSYHDYYNSLTQRQRLLIFNYYKAQYDFFGYPYPDYI